MKRTMFIFGIPQVITFDADETNDTTIHLRKCSAKSSEPLFASMKPMPSGVDQTQLMDFNSPQDAITRDGCSDGARGQLEEASGQERHDPFGVNEQVQTADQTPSDVQTDADQDHTITCRPTTPETLRGTDIQNDGNGEAKEPNIPSDTQAVIAPLVFETDITTVRLEGLQATSGPQIETISWTKKSATGGESHRDQHTKSTAELNVDVSIRFGRLTVVAMLVVVAIIAFAAVFNRGVVLRQFDSESKDEKQRNKLLDDYNSYTGNIASGLTKPVEPVVTLIVQVLIVRVLRSFVLRAHISDQFDLLTLAITSGMVFLINNSFNALNVQLRPSQVHPTISAVDLVYVPDASIVNASTRSTSFSQTFSELSPRNPITNTALRNLVLPRVPKKKPECDWRATTSTNDLINAAQVPDTVLEYGFAQRDWQSRMLEEAIPPQTLRLEVDATASGLNPRVNVTNLPMNASLAADLVVNGLYLLEKLFPGLLPTHDQNAATPPPAQEQPLRSDAFATVMGLLPANPSDANETHRREYFLDASMNLTKKVLSAAANTRPNGTIEFSHVAISSSVTFDAFTLEFEVDPLLTPRTDSDSEDSSLWYTYLGMVLNCLPSSAKCMVPKGNYPIDSAAYDIPSQVQVFAPCINSQGTRELRILHNDTYWKQDCPDISNTSLLVISIGKRVLADALEPYDPPGTAQTAPVPLMAVATNLRKVYTYTVGKLAWTLSNLSTHFHASCADDAGSCTGLRFPLSSMSNSLSQQELIVGAQALPTDLFFPLGFEDTPRYVPLVQIHEPLRDPRANVSGYAFLMHASRAGDPLLRHNIRDLVWEITHTTEVQKFCHVDVEDRLKMLLQNHMYIEHGLQTAYTAATFFLLQNGVVRDVIQLNGTANSLAFHNNQRNITVFASVPDQNAWLTIAGCIVLFLSVGMVILWSWAESRHAASAVSDWRLLGATTAPHVIARILLDSVHFPNVFLDRRVRLPDDEYTKRHAVDEFRIAALALGRDASSHQL